uniref:Putative cytochrome P450 n=1 Tax=Moniliophthora roreri TaxID=221103 RepID=A0A0W0G8I3_MONRR
MSSLLDCAAIVLAAFLVYKVATRKSYAYPLPPGPRGLPIFGNAFDMPSIKAWKTFSTWGDRWGPIMSFSALGQTFVLISEHEIADELLGKTGSLYADRPTMEMAILTGYDRALSAARYNERFREYRKLIGRVIGTRGNMTRFYPAEDYQANMFLKRVFDNPTDPAAATRKTAGAMILHITYGYKIKETGTDPLVKLADDALAEFSDVTRPGVYIVEFLPFLKYIPFSLFPFQKRAAECLRNCNDLSEVPFAICKAQVSSGEENDSYCATLLKDETITESHMENLKWSAASFYGAGADTTVSVVYCYFLVCCLYPEVQAKAQAEIDAVVGNERLPSFQDQKSLPYIGAVVKELCRWLPIVPLAVPHRAMQDSVYKGYFIPKGTYVIANVWKFLHDPAVYKDPMTFDPERFLGSNPEPAPQDRGLFGYGRRTCPGLYLADVSVWINVVKDVAGLHIECAVDETGQKIIPVPDVTDGVICRPVEFRCAVKPRSPDVLHLLDETLSNANV